VRLGQPDRTAALADTLASAWSEGEATGPAVAALAEVLVSLLFAGSYERAEAFRVRIEAVAERFSSDPAVTAYVLRSLSMHEQTTGNLGRSRIMTEAAIPCFERAGDLRLACVQRGFLGFMECLLGAYPEAVSLLHAAYAEAKQMGLENVAAVAQTNLGLALGGLGALDEARAMVEQAVTSAMVQGDRRMEGNSRDYLARLLRRAGDLEAAEAEARRAVELLEVVKPVQSPARATLADVLLARGRPAEALAEAREAMALLVSLGKVEEGEALVRLAHAEALEAAGDHTAARAAIADARDRLLEAAACIDDAARRTTFFDSVPENARTLALARVWLLG
jgi:tetratricopeptide (TPR) repeat protein